MIKTIVDLRYLHEIQDYAYEHEESDSSSSQIRRRWKRPRDAGGELWGLGVPTLSADDLGDVLGGGHGHALGHVLRLLGAVIGRRREAQRARQRVAGRQRVAEVQHAELERQLEGALVLHQPPAAQLSEQARRHFHLRRNLVGQREVSLSSHWGIMIGGAAFDRLAAWVVYATRVCPGRGAAVN